MSPAPTRMNVLAGGFPRAGLAGFECTLKADGGACWPRVPPAATSSQPSKAAGKTLGQNVIGGPLNVQTQKQNALQHTGIRRPWVPLSVKIAPLGSIRQPFNEKRSI